MRCWSRRLPVFLVFLLIVLPVYSQKNGITIEADTLSIAQLFERIEAQSDYTIAYNRSRFDGERRLPVSFRNAPVEEVMTEILRDSGWGYYIEEHHIILIRNESEPKAETGYRIRGQVYDKMSRLPLPFASVVLADHPDQGVLAGKDGFLSLWT